MSSIPSRSQDVQSLH